MAGNLTLKLTLTADGRAFVQTVEGAGKSVAGFTQKAESGFGRLKTSLTSAQTQLTALAATVGAGAVLRDILQVAGDFEAAMNGVAAVSGATGEQLDALRDKAKELGATTQFSASQAADAMGFLAQAGFRADEIIGAMPGTLQLAASAQLDLGAAADIVSNILTGYGKGVEELGHVNDVLVKAFTSANTNLEQLGAAMQYAGPVAAAAGVDFEAAAAAIALMGNAGIQGEMAGTALRGAISRLLNPTKEATSILEELGVTVTDAAGRLLPLDDIIRQLEPHAEDAGAFMEIFGQRAGPAMAALVSQGAGALVDLTDELENSGGTAERIADTQMEGFNGAMKALASASEGLKIALGESGLIESFTSVVKWIAELVREVSGADPRVLKMATTAGVLLAALAPMVGILGGVVLGLGALASPIGLVVAAVIGMSAIWVAFGDDITDVINEAVGNVKLLYEGVRDWMGAPLAAVMAPVAGLFDSVTSAAAAMYDAVVGNSYVPDMVDAIGLHFGRLDGVMVAPAEEATSAIQSTFDQVGRDVATSIGAMVRSGEVSLSSFADFVDQIVGRILDRMVQMAVVEPLANAFTTGLASAFAPGAGAGTTAGAGAGSGGAATGFGGVLGFAKGGVVDGPTVFPFARGVGLMGEAGPEAILPLKRLAGGDLGVRAELGGGGSGSAGPVNLEVRVVNQGQPLEVESTRESMGPNGRRMIEVLVREQVKATIGQGHADRAMDQRYGVKPRPR